MELEYIYFRMLDTDLSRVVPQSGSSGGVSGGGGVCGGDDGGWCGGEYM